MSVLSFVPRCAAIAVIATVAVISAAMAQDARFFRIGTGDIGDTAIRSAVSLRTRSVIRRARGPAIAAVAAGAGAGRNCPNFGWIGC